MKYLSLILGWLLAILFCFLMLSMLLMSKWLAAFVLLLLILVCLPPFNIWLKKKYSFSPHWSLRPAAGVILFFIFTRLLLSGEATSIYDSPETRARFIEIYDDKMAGWPVPFDDIFINSKYGPVHLIASGPQDATPMLLLHASGVSSWSWKFNFAELAKNYRTYAIDLIGDAGKSEFADLNNVMRTGQDQANLYSELMDSLGIETAYVIGASEGGFIGSNLSYYYPERVKKLALLGPMGYSGAGKSAARIAFAQFFPIKPIQRATFKWAFGESKVCQKEFGEWFITFMAHVFPKKVPPLILPAVIRQSIQVPVLFVFGEKDLLVGDPEKATALVKDIQDVRVKVVPAGHLMGAELPEQLNKYILEFFENE